MESSLVMAASRLLLALRLMGRETLNRAKRLGVRQSPAAFALCCASECPQPCEHERATPAKAAGDCRTPRRFAQVMRQNEPHCHGSAFSDCCFSPVVMELLCS